MRMFRLVMPLLAAHLREASDGFRARNAEAIRFSAAITPVIRMAILAGFVATLLYGGWLTLRGELGVGSYSALVYLTQRLLWPLTRLADMTRRIAESGDDPRQYVEITYRVSETKFNAWPETLKSAFEAARTVKTGKPSYRLALMKE